MKFVVAEVSNTPWRERHYYVLAVSHPESDGGQLNCRHRKSFHVSPFMDMNADYVWRISRPDNRLYVSLVNAQTDQPFFTATLAMKKKPLTRWNLIRTVARFPLLTVQIVFGIYYQALRLWMKRCPFYSHPNKQEETTQLPT